MTTFSEANQLKHALKMKLINYSWFKNAHVISSEEGYSIVVLVSKIDNTVKKVVAPVIKGIGVKLELE